MSATVERRPQAGAPSLDNRTQLEDSSLAGLNRVEVEAPYSLAMYPDACEAVLCLQDTRNASSKSKLRDDGPTREMEPSRWADLAEEERERRNWERSNRRAFVESRRYFVANRLRYQWVLTFTGDGLHGPEGRQECMRMVALFVRYFTEAFGRMPYWFSPELHPDGHGWHVNFYIPKRIPKDEFEYWWIARRTEVPGVETGYVWVSDKMKHPQVVAKGLPFVEALRLAAVYGCKYASKDWDAEQIGKGGHRFVTAEGFKPRRDSHRVWSEDEGVRTASEAFGAKPSWLWRSDDCEDWDGPPVIVLRWSSLPVVPDG